MDEVLPYGWPISANNGRRAPESEAHHSPTQPRDFRPNATGNKYDPRQKKEDARGNPAELASIVERSIRSNNEAKQAKHPTYAHSQEPMSRMVFERDRKAVRSSSNLLSS